ncbi:MAG: site-2 protease family protein, partial [Puniceicoccales bacterium]|nr:site-2 protease family protein [Puniceicoccales bacterium]
LDVRAANGEKRTVALTPVLRTETVELAQITFADGTATRKLRFAPAPDDFLAKKTPTTERRNLVLFDTLPTTSAYAETLRPGAILSSVDLPTGIVAVRTPAELTQAAQPLKNGTATLFFKDAAEPLRLESFDATVLPAKKTPFIGISYSGRAGVVHQTPFEQVRIAFALTFESIEKLIDRNSDVGINHLMGAISIAKTYYNAADDIKHILWFTLIININLAILNILPFPVLDGGHILIATIQKIIGRPLPLKILAGVQYIFVALFLSLMAYVLLNDVKRCSGDNTLKVKNVIEQRYVRTDVSFAPTEK